MGKRKTKNKIAAKNPQKVVTPKVIFKSNVNRF